MRWLRAWSVLAFAAFRRLLWSTATLMLLFPFIACGLGFVFWRHYNRIDEPIGAFQQFSEFLIVIFTSVVVPLGALAFGTAGLAGDREDRTLLFLLIRPLGRGTILSAKFVATLPLVLGFTCGGLWIFCRLAGPVGPTAFDTYLPAVVLMSLAYTGLFHLFAVYFKHATIAALVYAIFIEALLGNLPGIIRRAAINFYGRSLMYEAGIDYGLSPPDPESFEPIGGNVGVLVLLGITGGSLLLAWLVFAVSDYEETA
jgi:ABC-type transport system involved in multi-copper enzyme maturation permease subunit